MINLILIPSLDFFNSNSKSKLRDLKKFENSYFEGFILLTYILLNMACTKYEQVSDSIQLLIERQGIYH